MKKVVTVSLGSLMAASTLLAAAPAFAMDNASASTVKSNIATSSLRTSRGEAERQNGKAVAACLKAAKATRNTALHAAQAAFRRSRQASPTTLATSTERTAAKTAYEKAVRAAQATFAADRKTCLKK